MAPPNGKGIFVTQGDVTIQNLSFSGAAVSDNNGAGIRYEGGNLVIIDSYFHDNQMNLLANASPSGTIHIVGSEFADTLAGSSGLRHNLDVGDIASLVIDESYFHDAYDGHQIKSRASIHHHHQFAHLRRHRRGQLHHRPAQWRRRRHPQQRHRTGTEL